MDIRVIFHVFFTDCLFDFYLPMIPLVQYVENLIIAAALHGSI